MLGEFSVNAGTERAGYDLHIGPKGSGTRNTTRLMVAVSRYQSLELNLWTSYSDAGEVA